MPRSIGQEAALSESDKARPARRGFWISVLANACGTVLAAAFLAIYGQATGAIRDHPRGVAAVGVVILAGTVGMAYVALMFVVVPRLDDPEQQKAVRRYGLGIFLLLELAISVLGIPVYRWAGWSTGAVAALNILASFVVSMPGLV